jgi:putative ABC transport system permease protein
VGRQFEVRGIDPLLDPKVRVYVLTAGRLPVSDRYEAVLSQKYAQDEELELGGTLEIVTPNGPEKLEIVGLLADEGVAMTNSGAVAFIPLEVAQELFNLRGELSEIAVQVAPGIGSNVSALETVKTDLDERLGRGARVIYPAARGDLVPRMLGSYQLGLLFFSIIAIFTGAFLIYNTFSMTVVERTQEIGMLRAIGMSRSQVLTMVLAEAVVMALVGSALGIIAGFWLARSLVLLVGGFITMEQGNLSISPQDMLLSMGIGILVTLAAALLPARQAASIPPVEAMRVQARTGKAVSPLVWIAGLALIPLGWYGIYRLPWPLAVRIPAAVASFFFLLMGIVLTVPLMIGLLERLARIIATFIYGNEGALGSTSQHRFSPRQRGNLTGTFICFREMPSIFRSKTSHFTT